MSFLAGVLLWQIFKIMVCSKVCINLIRLPEIQIRVRFISADPEILIKIDQYKNIICFLKKLLLLYTTWIDLDPLFHETELRIQIKMKRIHNTVERIRFNLIWILEVEQDLMDQPKHYL